MYWILIRNSPKKIPSWPLSILKSYALSNKQSLLVSLSTIQIMENWVPVNKRNQQSNRPRTKLKKEHSFYDILWQLKRIYDISKKKKRKRLVCDNLKSSRSGQIFSKNNYKLFTYGQSTPPFTPPSLCPPPLMLQIWFIMFLNFEWVWQWLIEWVCEWNLLKRNGPSHIRVVNLLSIQNESSCILWF